MDKLYVKTCISNNNFGDMALNKALVNHIVGIKPICINDGFKDYNKVYLFSGSVLGWADNKSIVWGSGFLTSSTKVKKKPLKIHAVRGKLSRKKLLEQGIECPETFGDPALLYPKFYNPKIQKKYTLGIIPHYLDRNNPNLENLKAKGILIIDICSGVEKVINDVLSCRLIASSSLHGIIIGDAYNIPSIWIRFSDKVIGNGFKFNDYFSSVNRHDVEGLFITKKTTLSDVYNRFYKYKIEIDLNKLYKTCPLIKRKQL